MPGPSLDKNARHPQHHDHLKVGRPCSVVAIVCEHEANLLQGPRGESRPGVI